MVELGDVVRDKVSGLVGTAIARTEYLNGCIQYAIQPKLGKGKTEIVNWNIDEEQLEILKPKTKREQKKNGGATIKINYFGN